MNPTRAVDDASPDEWIAFERLLADLAALFANVASDAVVPAIEQAMGRLIGFLGFDRSSYVAVHDDDRMDTICSVATAPYQPLQRGALPMQVPWLMSELRAGRAVRMSSLPEGLPDWAVQERAFVQAQGIRSQMCVPLREGGRLVGMITLVAFHDTRAWPKALVARLSAAGHVFAQALARSRARRNRQRQGGAGRRLQAQCHRGHRA
jgi:formate hydrogenlyase transcriptional activator